MKAIQILKSIKSDTDYTFSYMGKEFNIDKAIAELEVMQNRNCESCKYLDKDTGKSYYYCEELHTLCIGAETAKDFYCKYWES